MERVRKICSAIRILWILLGCGLIFFVLDVYPIKNLHRAWIRKMRFSTVIVAVFCYPKEGSENVTVLIAEVSILLGRSFVVATA